MKKLVIIFVAFFVFATTTLAYVMTFSDVIEGDWFYDGVKYSYDNDLMSGYGDGYFGPHDPLTRAQFATVLERMDAAAIADLKADVAVLKTTGMAGYENWQTYMSAEGFSFMYPEGYAVSTNPDPENADITNVFILAADTDGTPLEQPPVLQMNVSDYSVSFSLWEGMTWEGYPAIVGTFVML